MTDPTKSRSNSLLFPGQDLYVTLDPPASTERAESPRKRFAKKLAPWGLVAAAFAALATVAVLMFPPITAGVVGGIAIAIGAYAVGRILGIAIDFFRSKPVRQDLYVPLIGDEL